MFNFDKTNTFCILSSFFSKKDHCFSIDNTYWNICDPSEITITFNGDLSIYEKCLIQTHIHIYNHIINNNIDYALIFEDRVTFKDNWVDSMYDLNYKNVSFIYLCNKNYITKNINKNKNNKWFLSPAYIVTKNTIQKLLDKNTISFLDKEDVILPKIRTNIYSYFPSLIDITT